MCRRMRTDTTVQCMMRDEGGDVGAGCGARWSTTCAVFLDTIHWSGDAFLIALGVGIRGEKRRWDSGRAPLRITRSARRCSPIWSPRSRALQVDTVRHRRRQWADQSATGSFREETPASMPCHSQEPECATASGHALPQRNPPNAYYRLGSIPQGATSLLCGLAP